MPGTLREFSQWLQWLRDGKPKGGPRTGEQFPAGDLFEALVAEAEAKAHVKALAADKERALEWLAEYEKVGKVNDPAVTMEHQFTLLPGRVQEARIAIDGEKLKTHYPALWAQCRVIKPFRQVTLAKAIRPQVMSFEPTLPAVPDGLLEMKRWPVSWGQAYNTYLARLDESKGYSKVVDDAVATMAELLQGDEVTATAVKKFWDGHGVAEFADGTKVQFDRLQFDQEVAAETVLDTDVFVDTSTFIKMVPEHETKPTRKIVRMGHEGAVEAEAELVGDPNPFEGD